MDNDSPFCLWVWEVEMSWMSPLLWMLSSLLGVCVGVVPAGSWEGKDPMCWAPCVVVKDPKQLSFRISRGLGNVPPGLEQWGWSHTGTSQRVSHHFCPPAGANATAPAGISPCSAGLCPSPWWSGPSSSGAGFLHPSVISKWCLRAGHSHA